MRKTLLGQNEKTKGDGALIPWHVLMVASSPSVDPSMLMYFMLLLYIVGECPGKYIITRSPFCI